MAEARVSRSALTARRRRPANPLAIGAIDYGYAGLRHLSNLSRLDLRRLGGDDEPGPPVLLLPGANETWRTLEAVARRLVRAGYAVDRVPNLGLNRLPIPRTAEVVAEHLRREGTRGAVLVGHSKGGIVGKILLARHAEEFGLRGLVAIASPWHGSPRARLVPDPALREFLPENPLFAELDADTATNARITTIRPILDQHIPEEYALPGAVNLRVPVRGHTLVLRATRTLDAVENAVAGYSPPDLAVAAVAIVRDRRVLMVRARARDVLYMPGGKIDPGETPAQAAAREAREELGIDLDPERLRPLFTVRAEAHDQEPARMVRMQVFAAETDREPRATAEVDEVHWVDSRDVDRCPPAGRIVLARLLASRAID